MCIMCVLGVQESRREGQIPGTGVTNGHGHEPLCRGWEPSALTRQAVSPALHTIILNSAGNLHFVILHMSPSVHVWVKR